MLSSVSLKESNHLTLGNSIALNGEYPVSSKSAEGTHDAISDSENKPKDKKDISQESKIKSENANSISDLSSEEKQEVEELKKIDAEVRRHEQAHLAAGGALVRGGASFSFQRGPDGQQYAVSGEVNIEMSAEEGDPKATIQKMQQVKRAALAPAEPSAQDRSVASRAASIESQARSEMLSDKNNDEDDSSYELEVSGSKTKDSEAKTSDINSNEESKNQNNDDKSSKYAQSSGFASLKQKYLNYNTYSNSVNMYA